MTRSLYDERTLQAADGEIQAAIGDVLSAKSRQAVIGVAPAGAGKSYAIGSAVQAARGAGLRIAVATPTNEQAFALVNDLSARMPRERVVFVNANGVELPDEPAARTNVSCKKAKETAADPIIVGTLNKLGDAFSRGDLIARDLLLIDEAYQANSVHYYMVGDLAPKHLLMGDSGQLAPFSTAPASDRWRGLAEDPLLTAVDVLRKNHPTSKEHRLPITRRLDPRAVGVVRAFYPGHPFGAAVLPGVRELRLAEGRNGRAWRAHDTALSRAAETGWAHVELPAAPAVTADPEALQLIVELAKRLFEREPKVRCERSQRFRPLQPRDVAVAVSHNDQKSLLRLAISRAGLEVQVDTANKLQGMTFEVVIAWHPLAGMMEGDAFHLDPGRLCVMLTRHRHACVVVGRAGDRELVQGIPPATPAYVGWATNPALDGWFAHEAVFRALEPHRIEWSHVAHRP